MAVYQLDDDLWFPDPHLGEEDGLVAVGGDLSIDRLLLEEGFTREYGAREMDRVIAQRLKPMLMREILFGKLKQGGSIIIGTRDGSLSVG